MINNITFQQIEAFLTVARYKSISKACDIMYISQPALSKILKRFEENIGATLFERTNHGVFLAPVGRQLYASLEPQYNSIDSTLTSVSKLVGPEDRFLHIALPAMFDICEDYEPVRALIRRYREAYPEVRVIKTIMELNRLQNMLDVGFVNFVVAPEPSLSITKNSSFQYSKLSDIRQYIAISSVHPLAGIGPDDLSQLSKEKFLAMPYQSSLYSKDLLRLQCRHNGIHPKSIECPPNVPTLLHGLRMDGYASIIWKTTAQNGSLNYIPLPNEDPPLRTVLAWIPERMSRAAELFLDML